MFRLSGISHIFSSTTAELNIISQWGWNKIHIFLFGWHNPLWPSAVLYASISQESFLHICPGEVYNVVTRITCVYPEYTQEMNHGEEQGCRLFLPWVHASYDASLDTYT